MTTSPRPQPSKYYILPKDDPVRAINILRVAAGLDPLSDDATPWSKDVNENRSSDGT